MVFIEIKFIESMTTSNTRLLIGLKLPMPKKGIEDEASKDHPVEIN
jgi:hypothetical protein